ncbi:MAG: hypothetical protein CSB13_01955 [Chloroflexi bacterium]|nr:MAG: hypothetical protein CSB13_01955 [Chloroflexota bacterium]
MEPPTNPVLPLSAAALEALVGKLYPEPSVVDILTLAQFILGYEFNDLGTTAVTHMERAQRITRMVGDHEEIGLAEFHIGLIYLHWGQSLGAVQYFDNAHRHWRLAQKKLAISLAHLAQGTAQQHAYHYEPALANYSKARHTLRQIKDSGYKEQAELLEALESALNASWADLIDKMHSLKSTTFHPPPPDTAPHTSTAEQAARETDPFKANAMPITTESEATQGDQTAPPPISNMANARGTTLTPARALPEPIPMPPAAAGIGISAQAPDSLPGIPEAEQSHLWYNITNRKDLGEFLPDICSDTLLLVDTRIELYACEEGDLVLVNQADIQGSIQLEPQAPTEPQPFQRIFLGEAECAFAFKRNPATDGIKFSPETAKETGKVKLAAAHSDSPILAENVIGIVVGILHKLHPAYKEPVA